MLESPIRSPTGTTHGESSRATAQLLRHIPAVDTRAVRVPRIAGDPPRLQTAPAWREGLLVDADVPRLVREHTLLLFEILQPVGSYKEAGGSEYVEARGGHPYGVPVAWASLYLGDMTVLEEKVGRGVI